MALPPRIYSRSTRESPDKVRSPGHRKYVRSHACILWGRPDHECSGPIDCCHVKARNGATNRSKATDAKTFSACRAAHAEQTAMGEGRFEKKYGIDLNKIADEFAAKSPYLRRSITAPNTKE